MQIPGREAELWTIEGGRVKCTACARYCRLSDNQVGLCGVRGAHNGKLYLYVYGRVIASHIDPIEKKPVTHFMPGTKIFSIATTGCNWLCHPAGTEILMSEGSSKRIEDIVPGDVLWSYDIEGGMTIRPSVVTHVGMRTAMLLEIRYGSRGEGRILLTEEHPVYTQSGWKTASELKSGDYIVKVWHQDTQKWREKRKISIKNALFRCKVCGREVKGLEEWNKHRAECYTRGLKKPVKAIEAARLGMLSNTAMRNPEIASRALENNNLRPLHDPAHGWNRNAERLKEWLHSHPSAPQLKLYELLDELGIPYEQEYKINPEKKVEGSRSRYIADAAIPEAKLVIEVDGYWQFYNERIREQDRIKDETLRANGWDVLRLSGSYLFNHPEEVKQLILSWAMRPVMVNKREWLVVKSVKPLDYAETVYSLECIPHHNYVADGILVHNCQYCQNFDISQRRKVEGIEVTPRQVAEHAVRYGSHGIAYTYNEPTIFMEFARDVGLEAKRLGLFNIFVTNGYWTPESVSMAATFLDAATVDFKGNGEREFVRRYIGIPDAEPIFQTLLEMKERTRIHIEITDLIVPQIGDDLKAARKLVRWVHDNLGPDTPIHFLRFHPDYKLMHLPWTPIETLEAHWRIAKEEGMNYAYIGNVPGHPYEHTYCPGCGYIVVERLGFDIVDWRLTPQNTCPQCGYKIAIVGRPPEKEPRKSRFIPVHWNLS